MEDRRVVFEAETIGNATLYRADCLAVLPHIGAVDAIVTDPPYGIGENAKKVASRGKLAKPIDYGDFDWDAKPATDWHIAAIRQSSKHQIIFGGNYMNLPPTKCWLVWDKENGENDFADCELAWTNLSKAVRRIKYLWNGMIRRGDDGERVHPTQKPTEVMRWCIGHLPDDVETICDPFMGSGTTGCAAASLGKRFIGIELDKRYFDIACKRIEDAQRQGDFLIAANGG